MCQRDSVAAHSHPRTSYLGLKGAVLTLEGAGGLAAAGVGEDATGALLVTCATQRMYFETSRLITMLGVRVRRSGWPPGVPAMTCTDVAPACKAGQLDS